MQDQGNDPLDKIEVPVVVPQKQSSTDPQYSRVAWAMHSWFFLVTRFRRFTFTQASKMR